jgi:capsular polysaccharide biosynthesis protein
MPDAQIESFRLFSKYVKIFLSYQLVRLVMSAKVSITLDEEVLDFVDRSSQNRSQFINEILAKENKRRLLEEIANAYTELANNAEYQSEVELWDIAVGDGIDA